MDKPSTFTLPAGTICMRNGLPFVLQHATQIECNSAIWSLIEIEPAKSDAAPPLDVATLSVFDVLDLCERSFVFFGGCTMTDMPHVPLSPETSWTMDIKHELAAIAAAKEKLCGAEEAHIACECTGCGTPQPTTQTSVHSIYEAEHPDSCTASEVRS